jgi:HTH-type transcriptional regulator/antitoxin HigA
MTRWLNPHKALIQLSLYGKLNDRFWFTFFHEAAHILLHDKKEIFLDEWDGGPISTSQQEEEADCWAREYQIPPQFEEELPRLKSKTSIIKFSEQIEIHPGVVVGRLQHDGYIKPNWMNDLKEHLTPSP